MALRDVIFELKSQPGKAVDLDIHTTTDHTAKMVCVSCRCKAGTILLQLGLFISRIPDATGNKRRHPRFRTQAQPARRSINGLTASPTRA